MNSMFSAVPRDSEKNKENASFLGKSCQIAKVRDGE